MVFCASVNKKYISAKSHPDPSLTSYDGKNDIMSPQMTILVFTGDQAISATKAEWQMVGVLVTSFIRNDGFTDFSFGDTDGVIVGLKTFWLILVTTPVGST